MRTGKSSPYYGQLKTAELPSQVKSIWYSRDDELPDLPTTGNLALFQQTDPDQDLAIDFARRLVEITPLTDREVVAVRMCVLEDCTLEEAGQELDCTRERVRQILSKALRRFRHHQTQLTGIKPWDVDDRVMPWFWWKHEQNSQKRLLKNCANLVQMG